MGASLEFIYQEVQLCSVKVCIRQLSSLCRLATVLKPSLEQFTNNHFFQNFSEKHDLSFYFTFDFPDSIFSRGNAFAQPWNGALSVHSGDQPLVQILDPTFPFR